MATYFARKAGNINASDVWATTPSGTASAVTFASGDVLMANSFAVTINVSTDLGATGEVRTNNANSATAGGGFTLSNGVTLTANCIAGTTPCVTFSGTYGNSASIVGNLTGGPTTSAHGCANNNTGTLNVTGLVTGGSSASGAFGAQNGSAGVLNITGGVFGGTASPSHGAHNQGAGILNITGTVTATVAVGANNNAAGTLLIDGTLQASEDNYAISGTNRAQVTLLTGPFLISPTFGVNPIGSRAWRWATALNNQTYLEVGTQTLLQKRNLVTPDNATNFPTASDVRSGTAYGIGGVLSGTCVVPNPAQVAAGTPVDDTVGTLSGSAPTASEVASAVWGAATSSLTTAGSIGERLKNVSTVATNGEQLASALTAPL
jgi:hypothetical protein